MREKIDEALATIDTPETVERLAQELQELRKRSLSLERRLDEFESQGKEKPRASF